MAIASSAGAVPASHHPTSGNLLGVLRVERARGAIGSIAAGRRMRSNQSQLAVDSRVMRWTSTLARIIGLALASLIGCAARVDVPQSLTSVPRPAPAILPVTSAPIVATHAVVLGTAKIYSAPSSAPEVYAFAIEPDARRADHGEARDLAVRVEEERLPWLRVSRATLACAATFRPGYEIALWVREQDLRAVTTRPISRSYPDGSLVQIARGAPVGDATPEGRWIGDDAWSFVLDVPTDAIGTRYAPVEEPFTTSSSPSTEGRLHSCAPIPFGGGQVSLEEPVAVKLTPARDGASLVTYEATCFRMRVLAPAIATDDDESRLGYGIPCRGTFGSIDQLGRRVRPAIARLKEGALVYWSDRTAAGRVLRDTRIEAPVTEGGRTCFRMRLTMQAQANLCAADADVVAE